MEASTLDYVATGIFVAAIIHTFLVSQFRALADRFPSGSVAENSLHLLSEVEVVFPFWGTIWVGVLIWAVGGEFALQSIDALDFTEPAFVFVIMVVAATRPVLQLAENLIIVISRLVPLKGEAPFVFTALVVGPLLGSFITEPAAMTVTALLLVERLFAASAVSRQMKYLAIGVLFVNVSIGGVLTPYAAPPVLMVAKTWGWDFPFMLQHFGLKAIIAVVINATLFVAYAHKGLARLKKPAIDRKKRIPVWLKGCHVLALVVIVMVSHHVSAFAGIFLLFLGLVKVTEEYQAELNLKESLLVAAFLGGLVVLGAPQSWWLQPLLLGLNESSLFVGAAALTAVTDNAALTYLGSQVQGLSDVLKYALVSGAVAGGGLTVIANAPNPAGYSILQSSFGSKGISPLGLLAGAAIPTLVAMLSFWFLPHFSN